MKRHLLLAVYFICFFINSQINSQGHSFQIKLDSSELLCTELTVNKNNDLTGLLLDPLAVNSPNLYVIDFSDTSSVYKQAFRFHFTNQNYLFKNLIRNKFRYQGNKLFINHAIDFVGIPYILISLNIETGSFWYKGISADSWFGLDEQNNSAILAANGTSFQNDINLLLVDANTGDEQWSKGYKTTDLQNNPLDIAMMDFHVNADEGLFIGGVSSKLDTASGDYVREAFLFHLDNNGVPLNWIKFNNLFFIQNTHTSDDAIYLLSRTEQDYPFNNNKENLLLIKLDFDLNIVWSKVFYAEEFEFNNASISIAENGTLTFGYSTFGYFPTILAKLNQKGEILWQKGYPLFQPELDQFSDGSMLMMSRQSISIDTIINIISKTDTLGHIEGCETFEACLEVADISLTTGDFNIEITDATWDTVEAPELLMDSLLLPFSDHCETPAPPVPSFHVPDTICIMDSISTTNLGNEYAHGTKWLLSRTNVDSIWIDSLVFNHRFVESGEYTLTQSIWYLGCEHSFQKTITVLPDLDISIETIETLCEPPISVFIESNRDLDIYLWSNGLSSESIEVQQDGLYAVSVSDGYCVLKDSINIEFISSTLNGLPPLNLPEDTIVCESNLPHLLSPTSVFSDEFILENILYKAPIQLNGGGEFELSISIGDCLFSEVFVLETENCSPAIFFPNVFSPNGDGINDEFFPQGKNFIPIRLYIFDRWGGLIYNTEGADLSWDGHDADVGVYTYILEYIATETSNNEKLYGTIAIVR